MGNLDPEKKRGLPRIISGQEKFHSQALSLTAQIVCVITKAFFTVQKENLVEPFIVVWQADRSR